MARENQNFKLYRGASRNVQIVLDKDTPNLTGGNAEFKIGRTPTATGADVLIRKRTQDENMALVFDPITTLYSIVVPLGVEDTALLDSNELYHQVTVTEANGRTHPVSRGKIKIEGLMQ